MAMETIRVAAAALTVGAQIVEWRSDGRPAITAVRTITHRACSKRGTHVNEKWCYEWNFPVEVKK